MLREILVPFALGLSVFTFVLLLARLLKLVELVVSRGVPLGSIARLFVSILPAFLEITVPMAMLLAILVAFGRLSADSELVALRSSGLSLYQLAAPVALVALLATVLTFLLSASARPWGNRLFRATLYDIASTRATAGLKPQVFNDDFPGLVIYAQQIDPPGDRLARVLIADERDPGERTTVFARRGLMLSDPETQSVTLRLVDGWMHTTDGESHVEYQTDFQSFDINLDLRQTLAGPTPRERDPKELTLVELRGAIAGKRREGRPYRPELVEYHRKFSIPFACIVFGLVAMPLGVQPTRAVRSQGFALSLVLIFVYYVFLSVGQAFAEQGLVPAPLGLWLPNVALGTLGVHLFRQAARGRTLLPVARLEGIASSFRRRTLMRAGGERRP